MGQTMDAGKGNNAVRRARGRGSTVLVVVVSLVLCGPVAGAGGVLGGWFLKGTWDAGGGGKSPGEAVEEIFTALDRWADEDSTRVLNYLCPERSSELRDRVRGIRAEVAKDPRVALKPQRFEEVGSGSAVRVSVMVVALATVPVDGKQQVYQSEAHEWGFDTVKAAGSWRVCGLEAPAICGVYVTC